MPSSQYIGLRWTERVFLLPSDLKSASWWKLGCISTCGLVWKLQTMVGVCLPQAWNTSCNMTQKQRSSAELDHRLRGFRKSLVPTAPCGGTSNCRVGVHFLSKNSLDHAIIQEQSAKTSFGPRHALLAHFLFECSRCFKQTYQGIQQESRKGLLPTHYNLTNGSPYVTVRSVPIFRWLMADSNTAAPDWVKVLQQTVSELVSELFKLLSSGEAGRSWLQLLKSQYESYFLPVLGPGQLQSNQNIGGPNPQLPLNGFIPVFLKPIAQVRLKICHIRCFRGPTAK